jgi:hypothetical protein
MNAAAKRFENLKVKRALNWTNRFEDIRVSHGKGTASGWLDIEASIHTPSSCYCDEVPRNMGRCQTCSNLWMENYREIKKLAQCATGREGEYDGNIQVKLTLT